MDRYRAAAVRARSAAGVGKPGKPGAGALALASALRLFVEVADLLINRHADLIDHTVPSEAVEPATRP